MSKRLISLLIAGCITAAAIGAGLLQRPETAAATVNAEKITVAVTGPTVTQLVPFIAAEKGFFTKRGLDVDVRLLSSSQAVPAIASGQVQFIVGAEPGGTSLTAWSTENAANRNKAVKLLGYWQPRSGGIGLIARPGINSVADLKGKTIGVPSFGGASSILVNLVLSRIGKFKTEDVEIIRLGTLSATAAAFNSGHIHAMSTTEPLTSQILEATPGAKIIFDMSKWNWVLGGIGGYMPWVKSHPRLTVQLLAAMNEALRYYRSNQAEARSIIAKLSGITDETQMQRAFLSALPFITTKVEPIREVGIRAVLHAMKQNGWPKASDNRWREVVDNRYAAAAAKLK